jgi:hypothetical protein
MKFTPRKIWRIVKAVIPGVLLALSIIGAVLGLFILTFGWHRFSQDFIPLDNSRIGPNLCASITIVVLVTAYHEYKVLARDEILDKPPDEVIDDMFHTALHPAETAEQNMAEDIAKILSEEDQ